MRYLFSFLAVTLFVSLTGCAVKPDKSQIPTVKPKSLTGCAVKPDKSQIPTVKPKPDITITAVGDIMLGTDFPNNRLAPNDGAHLLRALTPILSRADITFGNLVWQSGRCLAGRWRSG